MSGGYRLLDGRPSAHDRPTGRPVCAVTARGTPTQLARSRELRSAERHVPSLRDDDDVARVGDRHGRCSNMWCRAVTGQCMRRRHCDDTVHSQQRKLGRQVITGGVTCLWVILLLAGGGAKSACMQLAREGAGLTLNHVVQEKT
jgi:hypothetical protein